MAPRLLRCLALHCRFLGRQLYPKKFTEFWAKTVPPLEKSLGILAWERDWVVVVSSMFRAEISCCFLVSALKKRKETVRMTLL